MTNIGFRRDASQRLTFEMFGLPSSHYSAVCKELEQTFDLISDEPKVAGLDEVFQSYRRREQIVSLEWDNRSDLSSLPRTRLRKRWSAKLAITKKEQMGFGGN